MVFVVKVELKEQCIGNTYTTNHPRSNEEQAPHTQQIGNPTTLADMRIPSSSSSIVSPFSLLSMFSSFEEKEIASGGSLLASVSSRTLLSTARTS